MFFLAGLVSSTLMSSLAPGRAASPTVASVAFSSRYWLELKRKRLPRASSQVEERRSVTTVLPLWLVMRVTKRMFCV